MATTTRDAAPTTAASGSVNGSSPAATRPAWPLERVLFTLAGALTLIATVLAAVVSMWFLIIPGFVALNQLLYVATGHCGASVILRRSCAIESVLHPHHNKPRPARNTAA